MPRTPTFQVSTNASTNLLQIRLRGDINAPCVRACADEMARQLSVLRPGFRVLTDLSGINSMDTDCLPEVARLMDINRDHGVSTIVRVIPKRSKEIGFNILSLFHYPSKVHTVTCATLAEAEQAVR